jgi:TolB-like protein
MSFIAELRRRNVIRMAGLYLVGAWLVVQVAETLLPAFGVPDWVLRATIILLAIGFVPALVFAWVFEMTPEGLKREGASPAAGATAPVTSQRMNRTIVVLLLVAVAYFAVDKYVLGPPGYTGLAATVETAADAAKAGASIAVLPFVNMSADADNSYFADGISEELLNVLAGIPGLTVASRTSSFTFKGKDTPVPEIARQLGVQHVLEGSVRKQGNRVRITAQLIRAGTDAHLWSQTYDRDLTDIFQVQEEIAQAIADEMAGLLPVAQVSVTASTGDIEAYERFLRGRSRFYQRLELEQGLADLKFAVERDPNLAEAWVFLAATNYVLPGYLDIADKGPTREDTRQSLVEARKRLPAHPLVAAIEGSLQVESGDWITGLDTLARASELRANDSTAALWYGLSLLHAGYIDQALVALERAQRIDPLVGINNGYLGVARLSAGQFEAGAQDILRAADQGWTAGKAMLAIEYLGRGEKAQAAAVLADGGNDEDGSAQFLRAFETATSDPGKAKELTGEFIARGNYEALLMLGFNDVFLDTMLSDTQPGPASSETRLQWSRFTLRNFWLPSTQAIREDPRFYQAAKINGLSKLWEARGYPGTCTRVAAATGDHLSCPEPKP